MLHLFIFYLGDFQKNIKHVVLEALDYVDRVPDHYIFYSPKGVDLQSDPSEFMRGPTPQKPRGDTESAGAVDLNPLNKQSKNPIS